MDIYPSLISADILNLQQVINTLNPVCNGYHIDVMDDHFVPNLTWGPMFVNAIRTITSLPLHVHLMVDNPTSWLERIALNAGDTFIFHAEVIKDNTIRHQLITDIHNKGWNAGIAINPKTSVESIFDTLAIINSVLLMSVEPGFSGQTFIPSIIDKIKPLLAKQKQLNTIFKIGIDGGINKSNIKLLKENNVDSVAIAAAIFHQPDLLVALHELHTLIKT